MGDSIQLLVEKLIEGNAKMLLLSKQMYQQTLGLSEQIGRMREEIKKVKETDSGSLKNSSEQPNQKFPVTTTLTPSNAKNVIDSGSPQNSSELSVKKLPARPMVTPSVMKSHTTVVDVIEENHDEDVIVLEVKNGGEAMFDETVSVVQRRKEKTSVIEAPPVPDPPDPGRLAAAPPKPKPPDPLKLPPSRSHLIHSHRNQTLGTPINSRRN
ncbi:unnamed protein product [Trifolium pratense]|uniref:Uncharacterized protein n=1 Tax=Trifolium pratense TaxID=57577 RepID=A0ACB0LGE8_TRIPR|nr:unnamed protein product [Trifolium pratense]